MSDAPTVSSGTGKRVVWGVVVLLAILHYDFWSWGDATLWFGFLPVGLAYQGLISLAAGVAWALVVRFAWPRDVEEWASRDAGSDGVEVSP